MSNSTSANKIPDDTWSYSVETNIENSEIHSYFSTVQARFWAFEHYINWIYISSTNKGTAGQRRTCYMHKRFERGNDITCFRKFKKKINLSGQDGFWKSISEKFTSYQNNISKTRRIITLLGNFRLDTRESPWMHRVSPERN
ncbi:unnamed protein product [Rhizophagus irregularis]|nr:unnamed protein product [Rhizophagus irregularis]CAB4492353.1 unnamed protein product [Rhizophagus irregularis]CAB5217018.1 unnamed protein product [Rhizophagus irregularis]